MLNNEIKLFQQKRDNVITTIKVSVIFVQRFLLKIEAIKRVNRIEDRAESCPIPIFTLKEEEIKLFHK